MSHPRFCQARSVAQACPCPVPSFPFTFQGCSVMPNCSSPSASPETGAHSLPLPGCSGVHPPIQNSLHSGAPPSLPSTRRSGQSLEAEGSRQRRRGGRGGRTRGRAVETSGTPGLREPAAPLARPVSPASPSLPPRYVPGLSLCALSLTSNTGSHAVRGPGNLTASGSSYFFSRLEPVSCLSPEIEDASRAAVWC